MRRYPSTAAKATRVAIVLAYLCASFGLRLDVNHERTQVDDSMPFPCQGGQCGCSSASECWSNCCCLTPKQRIAWAKQAGITPPYELIGQVEEKSSTGCCSTEPTSSVASPCCDTHKSTSCCSNAESSSPSVSVKLKSPACQGKESRWLASTIDVVPVSLANLMRDDTPAGIVCVLRPTYRPFKSPPGTPPPEVRAV